MVFSISLVGAADITQAPKAVEQEGRIWLADRPNRINGRMLPQLEVVVNIFGGQFFGQLFCGQRLS